MLITCTRGSTHETVGKMANLLATVNRKKEGGFLFRKLPETLSWNITALLIFCQLFHRIMSRLLRERRTKMAGQDRILLEIFSDYI